VSLARRTVLLDAPLIRGYSRRDDCQGSAVLDALLTIASSRSRATRSVGQHFVLPSEAEQPHVVAAAAISAQSVPKIDASGSQNVPSGLVHRRFESGE
jgi:hypothetical protein